MLLACTGCPAPGYDASGYVTERVWAEARDGTRIPVSLVYRKGFRRDGALRDAIWRALACEMPTSSATSASE